MTELCKCGWPAEENGLCHKCVRRKDKSARSLKKSIERRAKGIKPIHIVKRGSKHQDRYCLDCKKWIGNRRMDSVRCFECQELHYKVFMRAYMNYYNVKKRREKREAARRKAKEDKG